MVSEKRSISTATILESGSGVSPSLTPRDVYIELDLYKCAVLLPVEKNKEKNYRIACVKFDADSSSLSHRYV